MKDNFLHKYFLNNGGKVIHKWLHYFDIYERYFNQYVDKPILMIEIGVFKGGSIDMWKDYFGSKSIIVGIDIDPNCKKFERKDDGIFIEIGDQSDVSFLQSVIDKYGNPDIILDDGSHVMNHLIKTFDFLYYKMKESGTYMVEDLHTAYWDEYGGGLKRDNTFIEFSKNKIDEINAQHSRGHQPITEFTKITQSMHVYDSIIVFEKRPQGKRTHIQTGNISLL
jgi:cephalosporin hydroxylase